MTADEKIPSSGVMSACEKIPLTGVKIRFCRAPFSMDSRVFDRFLIRAFLSYVQKGVRTFFGARCADSVEFIVFPLSENHDINDGY